MVEIIKETVRTRTPQDTVVVNHHEEQATVNQRVAYFIYFMFGVLEILLAFRLILKIAGASLSSGFVVFVYALSRIFILPFEGIFRKGVAQGIETASIFEPSTLVAMLVYAVIAWGIVELLKITTGTRSDLETG
jgi:hypothetical protein